ncbi:hypothetical protein [Paraglaciecola sp. L3A3]|uniref:hypothetical protein n=1 Tax=Paraglaciecola sp. L3A3 TaxID=2686358 RepID=UPI00131BB3EC|nr:hypothetical protein [Paraglaciecola sp. L3A3]
MNNSLLKYLLIFVIGGGLGYFISNSSQQDISDLFPLSIASSNHPANNLAPIENNATVATPDDKTNQLTCDENTTQLAIAKQKINHLQNTMNDNINEIEQENARLKYQLEQQAPSDVSTEAINSLVPEPYNEYVSTMPSNIKQEIYDFHQQPEDLDWGYNKQQQLKDFITTHVNSEFIKLTSIMCKIYQCEIILDEKITIQSLMDQGLNQQEIQNIIETQNPKYKNILDDLRLNPLLNMRTTSYTPGRFGIYMILKDKSIDGAAYN